MGNGMMTIYSGIKGNLRNSKGKYDAMRFEGCDSLAINT
jgi:hypothetical protein